MSEIKLEESLPSNSIMNRTQPQPKREKVNPVVKGTATLQKESFGAKVRKMFFPGDIRDIRKYAVESILIPAIKDGALALMQLALYGTVTRRSNGGMVGQQRTNYTYISSNNQQASSVITPKERTTHNFQNITFATYDDAEQVISTLLDLVSRYGSARVTDFYDAANIDCDWASVNWGWTSFQKLEPRAVPGGYIIDVSPPVLLK